MDVENTQQRDSQAKQNALNLSHGIKNILQAVKGGMEVVDYSLEINDLDRARRGWEILRRNLDMIDKLVLDMLQYSGESKPIFKSCDFNELVVSAVSTLQPQLHQSGKQMVVTTDNTIKSVRIDADRIYDVILNLILNAACAVPEHTGIITISTKLNEADQLVVLRVEDNGPGIEDTEVIFKPFHTAGTKAGTGLGLPIARKIVDQHKGFIQVASQPGAGSVFTVTLPVKQLGD